MPRRLPPLNPLRAFEAAARHGSITKAAGELNVTHGAISHQIKALESALGMPLFERAGSRLRLTGAAAELLPTVSNAFEEIAAATQRMTRPSSAGRLAINCVPALLSFWLLPRIGDFAARFPEVGLTLAASNDPEAIHARDVDICILYGDGSWTDCWLKRWTGLDLFPVASPTLINSRPIRTVRDLAEHVVLHADDGREWHTWLTAADALELRPRQQHRLTDARLAIEAAIHGYGVALGDSMTARTLLARGQLVAPFNISVPAVDAFYIACRNELRAAPVVRLFTDWLLEAHEEESRHAKPAVPGRAGMRGRRGSSKAVAQTTEVK